MIESPAEAKLGTANPTRVPAGVNPAVIRAGRRIIRNDPLLIVADHVVDMVGSAPGSAAIGRLIGDHAVELIGASREILEWQPEQEDIAHAVERERRVGEP